MGLNSRVDLLACSRSWPKYLFDTCQFIVKFKTIATAATIVTPTDIGPHWKVSRYPDGPIRPCAQPIGLVTVMRESLGKQTVSAAVPFYSRDVPLGHVKRDFDLSECVCVGLTNVGRPRSRQWLRNRKRRLPRSMINPRSG